MSLSSALVDRGRVITYEAQMVQLPDGSKIPFKVEGETQMVWVYGTYFDCRVDSPAAAESADAAGGRVRTAQHPTLIFDLWDDNEERVVLTADSKVSVESEDFGTAVFEVTGEPVIYRKKQGEVCGEAALVRMLNFGVTEGPVTAFADAATTPITIVSSGAEVTV